MMRCEDEGGTSVDQGIINLYDHFTHGGMSRREFLDRLAELAGSTAAAAALLPLLQNNYAQAAIVAAENISGVKEVRDHLCFVDTYSGFYVESSEDIAG